MNRSLFAVIILSSLFVATNAGAFTDGFVIGTIIETAFDDDTCESEVSEYDNPRYIYKTIDTELFPFTPKHQIKCYEIKIYIPRTFGEKMVSAILMATIIMMFIHIMVYADDDTRNWCIGYWMASHMQSSRRRC